MQPGPPMVLIRVCRESGTREGFQQRAGQRIEKGDARVKETGTVKWFNDAKGFGFITGANGEDVFVHYTAIQGDGFRTLREGATVEYEVTDTPKGLQAASVTVV